MHVVDFLYALPDLLLSKGLTDIPSGSKVIIELRNDGSLSASIYLEEK